MRLDSAYTKALAAMLAVLALHAIFYLTIPRGEFWPLSRYPMFSRAGHPWWRVIAVELPAEDEIGWSSFSQEEMPGPIVPLSGVGLELLDFTQTVRRILQSERDSELAMRNLLQPLTKKTSRLAVIEVRPAWRADVPVYLEYTPLAVIENYGEHAVIRDSEQ